MSPVRRRIEDVLGRLWNSEVDPTYADGDDASWLEIDWAALTRTELIDGTTLNFVDTGGADKPAVVFLHGLGGLWQNWLLNIPPLMDRHRVIALDLPGFGESGMPESELSIKYYAMVVDHLCAKLGIESAVIVGNSMGGFIGAEVALSFATRVKRLVLVSAAGLSTAREDRIMLFALDRVLLFGLYKLWSAAGPWTFAHRELVVRRTRLRKMLLQLTLQHPERLSGPLMSELVLGTGRPGLMPGLWALTNYRVRDHLNEIECPVLIVWGRNDKLVPVEDADRFEELIGPNARKVIFDDTGHCAMLERPTLFNELLAEFLCEEFVHRPLSAGEPERA